MSSEKYWWKGRIVKKKVYFAMLKRTENGKNRKKCEDIKDKQISEEAPESPLINVKGNRLVNLQHMASQLYCSSCKEPLMIQNIEKEKVYGLASVFSIRCRQCLLVNTVKSGEEYENPVTGKKMFTVNTKSALGKYISLIESKNRKIDAFIYLQTLLVIIQFLCRCDS